MLSLVHKDPASTKQRSAERARSTAAATPTPIAAATLTAVAAGVLTAVASLVSAAWLIVLAAEPAESTLIQIPLVYNDWCERSLTFTHVPAYGSFENLHGIFYSARPGEYDEYAVAVYIWVGSGWWNKPYWNVPLTPLQADGSWECDITTGGADEQATWIAAFVVPRDYTPPQLGGQTELPHELYATAVAHAAVDRAEGQREIAFSGYTWRVKASSAPVGPGPNVFSDREEDVWVDAQGRLHMRIDQHEGQWTCSEVIAAPSLGYGTYIWRLSGRVDQLDPNVVLGLFTWDAAAPEHHFREVDIEFSRWGDPAPGVENAQYVIQPWVAAGNRHRFDLTLAGEPSTHCLVWSPGQVAFRSYDGAVDCPGTGENALGAWTYSGPDVPPPGDENPRINLWLNEGAPPSDGQPVEVVIESFEFIPAGG